MQVASKFKYQYRSISGGSLLFIYARRARLYFNRDLSLRLTRVKPARKTRFSSLTVEINRGFLRVTIDFYPRHLKSRVRVPVLSPKAGKQSECAVTKGPLPIDRDAPFRHRGIRTPAIVTLRYWPSDKPPARLHCSEVIGAVDDKDAAGVCCYRSTGYSRVELR